MSYHNYRSESEECQAQISMYEQRMAESTARSLRHLDEAFQSGTDATKELAYQTEQLDRVETNLEKIDVSCGNADKELTNIQTIFGGVVNYFKKNKTTTKDTKLSSPPASKGDTITPSATPHIPAVAREISDPKTLVDRNLEQLDSGLDILNDLAIQLGGQIDDSNQQLDRIYDKQENVNTKVNKLNKKIHKLC